MKLRSLRVKNFLSFGEEPAEMKFGDGGVTFVVGPNNSGKSNIFRTLGFVADSFATWYPNVSPTPFLHNGRRDFEISVRVALNEAELQAVKDFIVCANTLYQFGGEPPESQLKARIRNEILTKHGGKLLRDFGNEVTLVVKGTEQQNIQFRHFLLLNWGKEQFLLQRDNYLSKTEMPETSGFGYAIFSELLVDDFKKRHPIELKDVGESDRVLDGAYAPPSVPELLASRLATEASKAGQSVFAGIQVEQLSFNAFEQRHGVAEPLKRLRNFLSVKGLLKDQITFNDLFAMIYTSSIVWVPDMRGSPPDYQHYLWERSVENRGVQYWGTTARPQIRVIGAADLPMRLFGLLTSIDATDQKRFDEIQSEFEKFTDGLKFRVFLEDKEMAVSPEVNLVRILQAQSGIEGLPPAPQSAIVGTQEGEGRKMVKVVRLQMLNGEASWPIRSASTGTVEVLTLLVGIIGAKDEILLLDEPAQNMHPEFQRRFSDLLKRHVQENINQAIVITHSPFLLTKDCLGDSWRVSKRKDETFVARVVEALAKSDGELSRKIVQQLDSSDARSLLFSRGAVFVEGLSDKWILEEISRKASLEGVGPNLVDNEWAVISMNTRNNTKTFLSLVDLLRLEYTFLLDHDARPMVQEILHERGVQSVDKETERENGFFILKTDIDDLFDIKGGNKPLKALDKALEVGLSNVPDEFRDFLVFLKRRIVG